MNQRIQALIEQVGTDVSGKWISVDDVETLAEAIIRECCRALNPMLRDMISRGQGQELIRQHFGIEERKGWVCPKCGVDRTRDVCPKGDSAVLTGDCPMTATAQTGVE